ncbi:MAG TPA: APC family permease [Candidatus Acidoferrum sp.]|nr:APC family permease [Candidatus Acidoferrum sp.]
MSNTSEGASTSNPAGTSSEARAGGRLLQVLGVWFGVAVAIGNAIAAGIVRTPGDIAKMLPNAWLFIGVWVVGGLYALFGASSLAELGAAIPRSGGQYNFSRRAIGEYAGFIVGWSDWLSTCGTAAAVSIVIAEYSRFFLPALAGREVSFAVAVIVAFFVLQWRGIRWGSGTQLLTSAIKTTAFMVLVAACFALGGHAASHSSPIASTATAAGASPLALPSGWPFVIAVILSLQAVVYTIDGWDGVVYVAGEVRDPGRDVPRAIFGSVVSVMGIYLLLNLAVLYVLPMNEIAGNNFALGTAAERIFGRYGDPVIRLIMIVSMLSSMNANQIFCTRTLHAMSCDGLFFRAASRVNRGGTPVLALFLSTVAGILFLLTGTFERVIDMLAFFFVANYALSYASLFLLRRREPHIPRPYRAWGYPWTTAIALLASVVFLGASIATDIQASRASGHFWPPSPALLALGVLALSYPVFQVLKFAARNGSPGESGA